MKRSTCSRCTMPLTKLKSRLCDSCKKYPTNLFWDGNRKSKKRGYIGETNINGIYTWLIKMALKEKAKKCRHVYKELFKDFIGIFQKGNREYQSIRGTVSKCTYCAKTIFSIPIRGSSIVEGELINN